MKTILSFIGLVVLIAVASLAWAVRKPVQGVASVVQRPAARAQSAAPSQSPPPPSPALINTPPVAVANNPAAAQTAAPPLLPQAVVAATNSPASAKTTSAMAVWHAEVQQAYGDVLREVASAKSETASGK